MNVNVTFDDMSERNSDVGFGDFSGIDQRLLNKKVDKQQGAENAGKVLGIGDNGLVFPTDMPKKLTDLENDLYYVKEKLVCEITKNDFVVNENIGLAGYEIEPMVEGLTPDNFTIKVHTVLGEETDDVELAHNTFQIDVDEESNGFFAQQNEFNVLLINGCAFTDQGEELKNATCIYLSSYILNLDELTVSLVLIDAKKAPKEIIPVEELPVVRNDTWQDLTDEQKEIARDNIGAAGSEFENAVSNAVYNGNQTNIPIVQLSGNGTDYYGKINGLYSKPPIGFMFVAIPSAISKSNTQTITIKDSYGNNLGKYTVTLPADGATDQFAPLKIRTCLKVGYPMLLLIASDSYAYILNLGFKRSKETVAYGSCFSDGNVQNKYTNVAVDETVAGSTVFIKFSNSNTATGVKLMAGTQYRPVLDRNGNAISAGKLQAGVVYQFVLDGTNWVLMD